MTNSFGREDEDNQLLPMKTHDGAFFMRFAGQHAGPPLGGHHLRFGQEKSFACALLLGAGASHSAAADDFVALAEGAGDPAFRAASAQRAAAAAAAVAAEGLCGVSLCWTTCSGLGSGTCI